MPNALAAETSPYLLQHRDNPVDWLPWGERALQRALSEDRPLLVSIGYSSCHWCHVMERESFEDPQTAALMNRDFVCVKVDREERPDVDAIYMEAVQGMTGHGGWPLNVFLTPEQVPFYGGTYFPPEPRHGMPAWPQVLAAVSDAWRQRREEIRSGSRAARERLAGGAALSPSAQPITAPALAEAVEILSRSYDARNGGFGAAPKFPPASVLEFLLRRAGASAEPEHTAEGRMALHTLRAMAAGGIHDQVGGGFSRYAVDATWAVPHFEKMLYDNALLARAYLHGWMVFGDRRLLRVCRDTLDWELDEMRGEEGAFLSALDADSEGVEGKYYVWTVAELEAVLEDDADAAIAYFGASEEGNFAEGGPGANVLGGTGPEPDSEQLARIRRTLRRARSERVRPALDDKRLTSWNALMICALAETGAVLHAHGEEGAERYLDGARTCARFLLDVMRDDRGRLLRTFNRGQARLPAYLEDHAFLVEALLVLYEATFEPEWFSAARSLADTMIEHFADDERGGFFSTADDHERLLTRRKDLEDAPIPAGASSAALGLLRLAALTGEHEYERRGVGALRLAHELAPRHPAAFGHLLQALELHLARVQEVAIVGPEADALAAVVRRRLRPHVVLAGTTTPTDAGAVPLLAGRGLVEGRTAAYVCENFSCRRPVCEAAELEALLQGHG